MSQGKIGSDRPISYVSRVMSNAEITYGTYEKELLAMVYAVTQFRPYLYGRKFTICTDHKPLVWAIGLKDLSSRLIRWKFKLEEYDYSVVHKSGARNTNADALSRIPYQDVEASVNVVLTRSKAKSSESSLFSPLSQRKYSYTVSPETKFYRKHFFTQIVQ